MNITPYQVAETFRGIKELPGNDDNPLILAMLQCCNPIDTDYHDEIPWCSAFVNFICKHLRLPRSHKLNARSWLSVGHVIDQSYAMADSDIVILKRGTNPLLGHVGFFAGFESHILGTATSTGRESYVFILGGNQSNSVSIQKFPIDQILGIRRLV